MVFYASGLSTVVSFGDTHYNVLEPCRGSDPTTTWNVAKLTLVEDRSEATRPQNGPAVREQGRSCFRVELFAKIERVEGVGQEMSLARRLWV